jgi:2'-5' RNA ligase
VRLFVAADIPDRLRDDIERNVVAPLRDRLPDARWTRPEGRHLTLKFLGNVADERTGEVADAVGAAASGHAPFEASFTEVGAFPNLRRPRVLWIGIGEGAAQFGDIARSLDEHLEPLGFAPESRPFRCHLTLARFKTPASVEMRAVAVPCDTFTVDEVVLFRTHLHPKGARYEALRRIPL